MNYLSHGYRFLDRPEFVVGTAVPDWLSVVNRRMRARSRLVQPIVDQTQDAAVKDIGLGILQHHHDDTVFHQCLPFLRLEAAAGKLFRTLMPDKYDHRPGFLGHISVELLLDAVLAERDATLLDRYYSVVKSVESSVIQAAVNQMATRTSDQLAWFIDRFHEEAFLYDYQTDNGLFYRLNHVLKRVRLPRMPDEAVETLAEIREMVRHNADAMLDEVAAAS